MKKLFFKAILFGSLLTFMTSILSAQDSNVQELWDIGVIDFENLTGDEELEWISRAIPLSLNEDLSQVGRFRVIERMQIEEAIDEIMFSISDWADPDEALDLSRQLAAEYLILGAYQNIGESVRIDVRVMDVESSEVLLAFAVSDSLNNFFSLENEIVFRLIDELSIVLSQTEEDRLNRIQTSSIAAFEQLTLGNKFFYMGNYTAALDHYKNALEIDPNYSDAFVGLGNIDRVNGNFEDAMHNYEQALLFNPENGEALFNYGLALYRLNRYQEASAKYEQALEIYPNNPNILNNLGLSSLQMGNIEESWDILSNALLYYEEDPALLANAGHVAVMLRKWEEAINIYGTLVDIVPDNAVAQKTYAILLYQFGDISVALPHFQQAVNLDPSFVQGHYYIGYIYYQIGDIEEGLEYLVDITTRINADANMCMLIARLYAMSDDPDNAIRWIEQAVNLGYNNAEALTTDPDFSCLQDVPEFEDILSRIN